jgi:hypothetical protein
MSSFRYNPSKIRHNSTFSAIIRRNLIFFRRNSTELVGDSVENPSKFNIFRYNPSIPINSVEMEY